MEKTNAHPIPTGQGGHIAVEHEAARSDVGLLLCGPAPALCLASDQLDPPIPPRPSITSPLRSMLMTIISTLI
jgi:hypothetical protein